MISFGVQLRKIRIERGVSINELAENIGFRRLAIYKWETGKTSPRSFETVLVIAKFFHVSPDYFLKPHFSALTQSDLNADLGNLRNSICELQEEVESLRRLVMPLFHFKDTEGKEEG